MQADTHNKNLAWPVGLTMAGACLMVMFSAPGLAPLAGLGGLVCWAMLWRGGLLRQALRLPASLILFGVLLLALLSATWAVDPKGSLEAIRGLSAVMIAVIGLLATASLAVPGTSEKLYKAMLWCFLLLAAFLLIEYGSDGAIRNALESLFRKPVDHWVPGTLNRANVAACLLVWPAAMAARASGMPRLTFAVFAVAVAAAFLSDQVTARPAILWGLLLALAVYKLGRIAVHFLAGSAALGTLIFPWLPGRLFTVESVMDWLPQLRFSMYHRLHIWDFAAERIAEKPWLGWGLDGSRALPGGETVFYGKATYMPNHPHNGVMHIWLELGLPGALLLLALQLLIWRALLSPSLDRTARAAACGLYATALVHFGIAFGIWQNWWVALLGLSAAAMVLMARSASAEKIA